MKLGKLFFVMAAGVFCVGIGVTADSHEAVSYTHLDVYKRQVNTESRQSEVTIGMDTKLLDKEAVDAAFSLKKGKMSNVIGGKNGYYQMVLPVGVKKHK